MRLLEVFGQFLSLVLGTIGSVVHDEVASFAGEVFAYCCANASGGTSHDGDFAFEDTLTATSGDVSRGGDAGVLWAGHLGRLLSLSCKVYVCREVAVGGRSDVVC